MSKLKFILFVLVVISISFGLVRSTSADRTEFTSGPLQNAQATSTAPKLEGCVSCHGLIETMHKYGTTETLDKLKEGRDAVGLSCTACHGANPAVSKTSNDPQEIERVKKQAH